MSIVSDIIKSGCCTPAQQLDDVLQWIEEKNRSVRVNIRKNRLSDSDSWYYDESCGEIRNKAHTFFSVCGLRHYSGSDPVMEQPIIIQDEVGYLGIICKKIDGVLHFLMQAKIEPGNINKIQISPTIQATKSNFTQKHGGSKPAYLDYFVDVAAKNILVDQLQSEQSSRFLGKRNRNIIIVADDDIEVLPSHRWMTLGTIKQLMRFDNLVNMDTRTVLSCIPYSHACSQEECQQLMECFTDSSMYRSVLKNACHSDMVNVFCYINNYKMSHKCKNRIVPLNSLDSWTFTDEGIVHKNGYSFKVVFCDIEIEGREVTHWTQPLFQAEGIATFGLVTAEFDGVLKFLVHAKSEAGCFDCIELAPTVQLEASVPKKQYSDMDRLFFALLEGSAQVRNNVILSEEGGRFYHEQNRNIVLKVSPEQVGDIPEGYFWLDYATLNEMVQFNNVLNIQLRNLLSILEF